VVFGDGTGLGFADALSTVLLGPALSGDVTVVALRSRCWTRLGRAGSPGPDDRWCRGACPSGLARRSADRTEPDHVPAAHRPTPRTGGGRRPAPRSKPPPPARLTRSAERAGTGCPQDAAPGLVGPGRRAWSWCVSPPCRTPGPELRRGARRADPPRG